MPLPDSDSYDTLGGELTQYSDVEDPTTDLPSDADNATRANVAAATRTLCRGFISFADLSVAIYDSVWGNDSAYRPTIESGPGLGIITLTFPTTVPTSRNNGTTNTDTTSVNIRAAHAWVEWGAVKSTAHVNAVVTSANVIRLTCLNSSLVAADPDASETIHVEWK